MAGLQADGGDLGHACGRPGMARVDVVRSGHGGRDGTGGPLCRAIGWLYRAVLSGQDVDAGCPFLPEGGDAVLAQAIDQRILDAFDQGADAQSAGPQVQHQVGHDLAGAVIGDLTAALRGHHRDVARIQQVLGLAVHAQREHGRMLHQPDLVAGRGGLGQVRPVAPQGCLSGTGHDGRCGRGPPLARQGRLARCLPCRRPCPHARQGVRVGHGAQQTQADGREGMGAGVRHRGGGNGKVRRRDGGRGHRPGVGVRSGTTPAAGPTARGTGRPAAGANGR